LFSNTPFTAWFPRVVIVDDEIEVTILHANKTRYWWQEVMDFWSPEKTKPVSRLVGWSLTSLFSRNTAVSETKTCE